MLLANNVDPDQTAHNVASDLGLHFLPMTLLWVSSKNEFHFLMFIEVKTTLGRVQSEWTPKGV